MARDLSDRIQSDRLIRELPEAVRSQVGSVVRSREIKRNSLIFSEGDDPVAYYCLLDGEVSICKLMPDGSEVKITRLVPPYWFGEMSFLDGAPRTHSAYAATDVRLAIIPGRDVLRLKKQYPEFMNALVLQLCQHARLLYGAVDDFLLMSPERLLAKRLLELHAKSKSTDQVKLTQDELARLIGVSRQSVNRILGRWESENFISRRYGLIVLENVPAIRSIMQS